MGASAPASQAAADAAGEIDWDVSVDSTIVRADQHAAGPSEPATCSSLPLSFEDLHPHNAIELPLRGAENGIDLCQAFVQLTGPPGNTILGVARHLLAEP